MLQFILPITSLLKGFSYIYIYHLQVVSINGSDDIGIALSSHVSYMMVEKDKEERIWYQISEVDENLMKILYRLLDLIIF